MNSFCAVVAPLLAVPATAFGTAYFTNIETGPFPRIDLHTIEFGSPLRIGRVGALGTPSQIPALAFDFATATMYGTSFTSLYTINLQTGLATEIGTSGLDRMHGLAINPVGGAMYGITLDGQLCSIDRTNGHATSIGPSSGIPISALTFAPDGRLLGCAGPLGPVGVYQINPNTGLQTLLFASPTLSGMAFDPIDGQLYGIDNADGRAYRIDLDNRAFISFGSIGGVLNPKGLSFTPAPPTAILLAAGLLVTHRRRNSPPHRPTH